MIIQMIFQDFSQSQEFLNTYQIIIIYIYIIMFQSLQGDKNLQVLIDQVVNFQKNQQLHQKKYQQFPPHHPYLPVRSNPMQGQGPPRINRPNDYKLDSIHFQLYNQQTVNTTINSDQLDIQLRTMQSNKTISLYCMDKQREFDQSIPQQPPRLRIEFKIEEINDEVEVNFYEFSIKILTKSIINQQQKPTEQKRQAIQLSPEIFKAEGKLIQVVLKLQKELFKNTQSKQQLTEYFKSLGLNRLKFIGSETPPPLEQIPQKPIIQKEKEEDPIPDPALDDILPSEKEILQYFPKLSDDQMNQVLKYKETLSTTSNEEKMKKLQDELRLKQLKNNSLTSEKRIFKCPVASCNKQFNKIGQLKSHIKKNHQKLSEIDFQIDDNGEYKWNEKALDYCLILNKICPLFVKQVLNDMKQRKD
ncbi:hypothetical protein pb186bvf_011921 [Paramecium bursaria]